MTRCVFFVSDSTAITSKGLGTSLLSQFDINFKEHLRPYINTKNKIFELLNDIKRAHQESGEPPIVFASMMDDELMQQLSAGFSGVIDIFRPFMPKLELLIDKKSSKQVGQAHKVGNEHLYQKRVAAIDFSLATDDGLKTKDYNQADLILLGVSRSGKTPTALYLALNFGLKVANYPFTSEDFPVFSLSKDHLNNKKKLVGLIIRPQRLLNIRRSRYSIGNYADPQIIEKELNALKSLFEKESIPFVDTTTRSVEEIAARIMAILQE
ncbi:MAG: pyruvate, phosphate dikinase/phosphoenolpyruvate synthase regulator [Myxococcales bacterium]|nr:pyruvate, phosphate dikinase/phosphoenolpyruvate synthase regulator [Myxococcales bacterium]